MIGGFDENEFTRRNLSASIPYQHDDISWCVPKARLAPNWDNVFAIFTLTTWITSIIAMIICGYILHHFVKIESVRKDYGVPWSMLISFAVALSCPGQYFPQKTYVRFFFITIVIYGIHFNAAYHSFLISVLTRPRYEIQISTMAQMVKAGYEVYGARYILQFYNKPDYASHLYLLYSDHVKKLFFF